MELLWQMIRIYPEEILNRIYLYCYGCFGLMHWSLVVDSLILLAKIDFKTSSETEHTKYTVRLSTTTFCRSVAHLVQPVLVSLIAICTTLAITLAILHWNYVENAHRKMTKKQTILNHWGKHKPTKEDIENLFTGEALPLNDKSK